MKSEKLLKELTEYCETHPEERLWQAIRNWSGFGFILASESEDIEELNDPKNIVDTFYFTGRKQ